jgi:hypothetical protein
MAYADSDLRPGILDIFDEASRLPVAREWLAYGYHSIQRRAFQSRSGIRPMGQRRRSSGCYAPRNSEPVENVGSLEGAVCPVCGKTGSLRLGARRVFHGNSHCLIRERVE